ncbi:hypothetical protein RFI_32874, partial [Reticulomyxa filosa]
IFKKKKISFKCLFFIKKIYHLHKMSFSVFIFFAITNKWSADIYKKQVDTCQKIMLQMGPENIPEIYWIKGHSGIPGNEKADDIAKKARKTAQNNQPELYQKSDKSASFLNADGLDPYFTLVWNRHWTNEGNENHPHEHSKKFIRNLIDEKSFEKIVLNQLEVHERRIICRIITGKVVLNYYLHKINPVQAPECDWCRNEHETLDHFLMKCPYYNDLLKMLYLNIKNIFPELYVAKLSMRKLVIGSKRWNKNYTTIDKICDSNMKEAMSKNTYKPSK